MIVILFLNPWHVVSLEIRQGGTCGLFERTKDINGMDMGPQLISNSRQTYIRPTATEITRRILLPCFMIAK